MTSVGKELAQYGLRPRKSLGQHFLTDPNILNKVVESARIEEKDVVLEVGPGLGKLTAVLAEKARRVFAVEIDEGLAEVLRTKMAGHRNVEIIRNDILEVNFHQFIEKEGQRLKVVANLPYQISTPLLFRFIDSRRLFASLTLMLQKEVARRMTAAPGGKDYGVLSIFTQAVADCSIRFLIKPSAFVPPPRVHSAVIHMVWKRRPIANIEDEWFKKVVRGSFLYRRKTLINALRHSGLALPENSIERIKESGIDPQQRPETLTIEEFALLADTLKAPR